jgi:hypothetical protein
MVGAEVSFDQFRQLVTYAPFQKKIGALLSHWYGYEIVGQDEATVVQSASAHPVSLELLHQKIQREPAKQYELYQVAMGLWHLGY